MKARSKTKKKPRKRQAPIVGIVIDDTKQFTLKFRQVLKAKLGNDVGFNLDCLAGGSRRYVLSGPGVTMARSKRDYPVLQFCQKEEDIYWLGCCVKFGSEVGRFRLREVSIIIFKGDASDPEKTPILRAEWDCPHFAENKKHAQPHWHVYTSHSLFSPENRLSEFNSTFNETESTVSISDDDLRKRDQWEEGKDFHFAMSSNWHSGSLAAHRLQFSESEIVKWLEGCIDYILTQLAYLS